MDIKDVIKEDIKFWQKIYNEGKFIGSYLYLYEYPDSEKAGCTSLYLTVQNFGTEHLKKLMP